MDIPIILDISSGLCNSSCNWCYVPYLKKDFGLNKFMKYEDVEKIVKLNMGHDFKFYFTGFGEALINPDFFKIFNLIGKNFKMGSMMTNFSKELTESEIEWMLLKLEKLVIEMGGLSAESRYENMHIENDFFFKNMHRLDNILIKNPSLRKSCSVKRKFPPSVGWLPLYILGTLQIGVLLFEITNSFASTK